MIKSRHHPFYVWFFNQFSRIMLHRNFRTVHVHGNCGPYDDAICLVGNHFSWWDGFIAQYLNGKCFYKKLHIMMLEEQLKGRSFLNKAGAFSINKDGGRSMIESLQYATESLEQEDTLLVMYPQGEIQSIYTTTVKFEKGLERIRSNAAPHQLIYYHALVDYYSEKKPLMNIYLWRSGLGIDAGIQQIEKEFNHYLQQSLELQSIPQ